MKTLRISVMIVPVFLMATLLCDCAFGQNRSREVVPGVYVITDLSFSNTGFIVTDSGVVVVDTQLVPLFAKEVLKEIRAVTDKPVTYVINTHWHTDHVGGNEVFVPQARIIGHDFTRTVMERRRRDKQAGKVDESLKQLGEFSFVPPDITFSSSLTLFMGSTTLELHYLGGGHTGGDIVVYLPRQRVLFSGDLFIKGSGLPDYRDDSSIDRLIASQRRLQEFDVDKIVCGHGDVAQKQDIQGSIDKLTSFRARVAEMVNQGISAEAAARSITFPAGENPFYKPKFEKMIYKVYGDIKNSQPQAGAP